MTDKVTLSVVVPTIGRATLGNTLGVILRQITKDDELIVVVDSSKCDILDMAFALHEMELFNSCGIVIDCPGNPEVNGFGQLQKNAGILKASKSHICFMDDDDIHSFRAFQHFRNFASDRPVIFRMKYKDGSTLWGKHKVVRVGNYGTPCFLVPNYLKPEDRPLFGMHYCGDADYIKNAIEKYGQPVWREEVVSYIRPDTWE